jgi:hypothetical protein
VEVDKGIYDVNGFQIRFFTETKIHGLATEEGFKILRIKEKYDEPVTLYLVRQENVNKTDRPTDRSSIRLQPCSMINKPTLQNCIPELLL